MSGSVLLEGMIAAGLNEFVGVPCSLMNSLTNALLERSRAVGDCRYTGATSEGEAVGIAAGMRLAGGNAVVLAQNSGLGNTVNPISSLLAPMRIPLLLLVSWRGHPTERDEPQHQLMGVVTEQLCELLNLAPRELRSVDDDLSELLHHAASRRGNRQSTALLIRRASLQSEPFHQPTTAEEAWPTSLQTAPRSATHTREDLILAIVQSAPADALIVASTGYCSRDLFNVQDAPRNFYMVGSMGCASAIGLGVALRTTRTVIVLDGDGAALMKLGNLTTIGRAAPSNLIHTVLDNGVHESTGGQPSTAAGRLDFGAVARLCGYRSSSLVTHPSEIAPALATRADGPLFIHALVKRSTQSAGGRPTLPPDEMASRFSRCIGSELGLVG